ncbi:Fibronectin type 3 and ankyrin repeat domains 1 [Brachionus plicatilis]|uniref:Fibronectin type 3 and ankyrin repeat domains 1 n=1 Tax=Brachionus plicatilis TaxID=10195 RepID=A0A3M7TAM5_BRAPC|nr:Fibronectin type 3 and ankyrin repeat domains 1 [Brachionus plicatilis]
MLAAFYGKLEFVKELRANNASYDLTDKTGMTVVHYAVDGGNADVLQWILLDGAEINKKDSLNGWTPLLRAASVNASGEIARILLKYGAKVDALDKENKNALLISTVNGNLAFVKTLIQHGANFNTKNNFGKSVYDLAVSMDRKAIVKFYEEYMQEHNLKVY